MLNEKKLSKAELAKREDLIMSMKKNKRNLVKKYGSDAEKVMYGRATNLAKKLAEQDMEQNKLKEMVKAALMQPVSEKKSFPDLTGDGKVTKADILKGRGIELKEGPEDKFWATYVKSLVNDIRLNGVDSYTDYSEDDFIEDYENYIGDKMSLGEDLDLGHQDNEPHMLKGDLYRIGKYAMELYQMVDGFEGEGEVDFPAWWQAKITTSMNNMVGAKHYLDFEIKEPAIDAVVDRISDVAPEMEIDVVDDIEEIGMFHDPKGYEKPKPDPKDKIYTKKYKGDGVYDIFKNDEKIKTIKGGEGEANAYINQLKRELEEAVNTRHIEDHEYMAAKIQKAMNDLDKKSEDYESKLYRLQQARKANNKSDFKTAMKIMKPFLAPVEETQYASLAEKLAKQLKSN